MNLATPVTGILSLYIIKLSHCKYISHDQCRVCPSLKNQL